MWRHWHNINGFFALMLVLWLTLSPQDGLAWQNVSAEADPVQVWVEQQQGEPFLRVRAEVSVTAPIFSLLHLLQDPKRQHEWLPHTHAVNVIAQPAPGQTLVRFESEAQWPFSARDAVTLFAVTQPEPDVIQIAMLNQPDALPLQPSIQRIQHAAGYWRLTALDNCSTLVRYEAGSRWGGNIPQWLVNRLNQRIAQQALRNFQQWAPTQTVANQPPPQLQVVPRHVDCR